VISENYKTALKYWAAYSSQSTAMRS